MVACLCKLNYVAFVVKLNVEKQNDTFFAKASYKALIMHGGTKSWAFYYPLVMTMWKDSKIWDINPPKIQSMLLLKLREVKQVLAKKKYKRTTHTQNSCLYRVCTINGRCFIWVLLIPLPSQSGKDTHLSLKICSRPLKGRFGQFSKSVPSTSPPCHTAMPFATWFTPLMGCNLMCLHTIL